MLSTTYSRSFHFLRDPGPCLRGLTVVHRPSRVKLSNACKILESVEAITVCYASSQSFAPLFEVTRTQRYTAELAIN